MDPLGLLGPLDPIMNDFMKLCSFGASRKLSGRSRQLSARCRKLLGQTSLGLVYHEASDGPFGPFGTLGPYLFSYLGSLWALLGPLALLDPLGLLGPLALN